MTGLAESSAEGTENPYILSSIVQPNFQLGTDATSNSIRATGQVFDLLDENPVAAGYLLTFGPASGSGGANAFVDDDHFGALANDDNGKTRLITDAGKSIANVAGDRPGSYIVSGRGNRSPAISIAPAAISSTGAGGERGSRRRRRHQFPTSEPNTCTWAPGWPAT